MAGRLIQNPFIMFWTLIIPAVFNLLLVIVVGLFSFSLRAEQLVFMNHHLQKKMYSKVYSKLISTDILFGIF